MITDESRPALQKMVIGFELPAVFVDRLRARFPGVEFVVASREQLIDELPTAEAVVSWGLTPAQIAAAPRLTWLQVIGAGVDGVLIPELLARDIVVTNNSGVHAPNIAEHILGMMLAFARALPYLVRAQQARKWRDDDGRSRVFELNGQTLLCVGLGDIAIALGERAHAMGMRVLAVRRRLHFPAPPIFDGVVGVDRLRDLLPEADHVVICLPLTPATRSLFDTETLAAMKPGAYLYNIGRGPIIDSDALIDALRSGRLGGAGLDVTDPEPLPPESPLWAMENVLITAHTSGATPNYWMRGIEILETNIARFLAGQELVNVVDVEAGY